jgi:excisionase family DNA binding protein
MAINNETSTIPGYVSSKQAASMLGISKHRLYQYVKAKRLHVVRVGKAFMVPVEEIEQFKLHPPGRARTKAPDWRVYNIRSKLLVLDIEVPVLPGRQERLLEKLLAIQEGKRHIFPGTMARYVLREDTSFASVSIWLVWKDTEMPGQVIRDEELTAFKAELADVLDWDSASQSTKEGIIYT